MIILTGNDRGYLRADFAPLEFARRKLRACGWQSVDYLLRHAGRLKSMMYREVTPARHHLPPKSHQLHVNPRRLGDRFEIYGIE